MARIRPPGVGMAAYEAAPNIALVKYWGMRDATLVLPYNSSLSMTIDRFRTRTEVAFDSALRSDRLKLNDRVESGGPLSAVSRFLDLVRERAGISIFAEVRSSNDFPTASGLASSASGFAALAGASSAAAGLSLSSRELSRLARRGSGSASRSVFGGFVTWRAGRRADGGDSYAEPVAAVGHWPSLRDAVVLVRNAPEKRVRSAVAMQASVRTSPLFPQRIGSVAARLANLRSALRARDTGRFLRLLMEECDDFRAVCESTVPPLDYLTSASRKVLSAVHDFNRERGETVVGYTHDAGAHVHVFTTIRELPQLRRRLLRVPGVDRVETVRPGPGLRPLTGPAAR